MELTLTRIAFLGLGAMGTRMAARLIGAGYPVAVWSRSRPELAGGPLAGATTAATAIAAASEADIVISMVTDDEAARSVWLDQETGAASGLRPGTIAIECSTVTPGWIGELSRATASRGAGLVDAPVAGSRPQAEAGQLIFMAGGDAETVAAAEPILAAMGSAVHHVGALGQGAAMKLAVNTLFAGQVALAAEVLQMLLRTGVAQSRIVDVLSAMPVTSPATAVALRMMAAGTHAPLFPIALVAKDLRYATPTEEQARMPVSLAVRNLFEDADRRGFGRDHITAVVHAVR